MLESKHETNMDADDDTTQPVFDTIASPDTDQLTLTDTIQNTAGSKTKQIHSKGAAATRKQCTSRTVKNKKKCLSPHKADCTLQTILPKSSEMTTIVKQDPS